jgi:transposase
MAKPLLTDEFWDIIEPLLPPPKPRPKGGRPPVPNRKALTGILFVLKTGIPWEDLPQEMGCGSGMTCWRRLRDWQEAGLWDELHRVLLAELRAANLIDWSLAVVDSSSVRAVFGGRKPAPTPRIGGKTAPSITRSRMRTAFRSLFG